MAPSPVMVVVKPVVHSRDINPEGEGATRNQRPVVLRPVGDGVKRLAQDAELKGDGGDQITTSSVSSIQAVSIWATTPSGSEPSQLHCR